MLNNIYNIFFIPEIFLACSSFVCLLFGLFLKKNAFRQTSNLAVFVLLLTILLVYNDSESNFANYKSLFSHSSFINFFKILALLGSIASIIISKDYFLGIKLKNFEIPILFYLLCILLIIKNKYDPIDIYLAWGFVLFRLIHSLIRIPNRNVLYRYSAFIISLFFLIGGWISFIIKI